MYTRTLEIGYYVDIKSLFESIEVTYNCSDQ